MEKIKPLELFVILLGVCTVSYVSLVFGIILLVSFLICCAVLYYVVNKYEKDTIKYTGRHPEDIKAVEPGTEVYLLFRDKTSYIGTLESVSDDKLMLSSGDKVSSFSYDNLLLWAETKDN